MLATRIIPCLDVQNGRVVKGTNFLNIRDAGDPVERAALYDAQGADELVFLDITASHEKRDLMFDYARRVAEEVFIPFCVGGGIKTVEDFRRILKTGADKASINTAAVTNPELITECSRAFGAQCVVVAIDPKKTGNTPSGWEVHIHGGRTPTGIDALDWALEMEDRGAGEIMLTSMDADGTLAGYDIPLTQAVTQRVNIPVIASGGAGTLEHIHDAVTAGGAQAALVSSIVHYGTFTVGEIKDYLAERGIPVRRV
ncbi:imidazole glycerol phosphate synthase subunit HisF [Capsulimonas corticalis]|uniref:Imidazole glycerol phosphate synthase subunit HisF n=1 Tax=Capsulimonas corticalis TaxID=2219043 RepID=A0A402D6U9_9BACT|nr:imidazole glycerol phosphate synthase subunit HisF [Capsulimonas corticalis]BDI31801.1 imidazole glycerol phosphate synthase subunit HisF [Capsulimonas corticalis]